MINIYNSIEDKMTSKENLHIDFGFKTIKKQEKQKLVKNIFDSVAKNYDIMNDITSFGIHRFWKEDLINWIAPYKDQKLLDLAGGTGDVAYKFLNNGGGSAYVFDINYQMIKTGRLHNKINKNINWIVGSAENIPIPDNTFERATMAFGLRNITDRELSLHEIYRVLKPGGRFICLEFSHMEENIFKQFYDLWSFKAMPLIGKYISNNKDAYNYLVESIRMFPNQNELAHLFSNVGFDRIRYRNLTGGIVAMHSGWKF